MFLTIKLFSSILKIQFSMNTKFNCQKHFYFKLFKYATSYIEQILEAIYHKTAAVWPEFVQYSL